MVAQFSSFKLLSTIFGLVFIIISDSLLLSRVEAHTFQIIADCEESLPGQIPIPTNPKAVELLTICLGQNPLVVKGQVTYKITGLKIQKMANAKKICTYTLDSNNILHPPLIIQITWGEFLCHEYTEFRHDIKITAYCNADTSSLDAMLKPINAKAMAIYNACLGDNGIGEIGHHEIRVNENVFEEKYICTYIFKQLPLVLLTKDGEEACLEYSEIEEEEKMEAEQNAKIIEARKMQENARKEMMKKGIEEKKKGWWFK
ncbi:hypothetical protein niasHS_004148 [Heterodera schachtii]|uniref:Uncharacterized protein n=1 Tax=Heterodera schachtii TaxID=97005 RepID=A0ABD2JKQ7_HETSC